MGSNARAQRRRQEREQGKQARRVGQPPKVPVTAEAGVEVDVVDDGVVFTLHAPNVVVSVKWRSMDAVKIGEMIAAAGGQTVESAVEVELASGFVIAREMP